MAISKSNWHDFCCVIFNIEKFCLIFAMLISASKQYSASIAFTLALFSHLVNHVNIRLQAELEEGESDVPPLRTDNTGTRAMHHHFSLLF